MKEMKNNIITDEELENVAGGVQRVIDTEGASAYANIRVAPGLGSDVMLSLRNGAHVFTTGRTEYKDGYTWYELTSDEHPNGWIAGSLIGY